LENGVDNARFVTADARRGLDQVLAEHPGVDLLLLDPPRSGAGRKVMRKIGRARPKRVVYVSCNPATLAEDCAELLPFGYELVEVRPVDMFPHTAHVECVTLLDRKGAEG
jgi:23S rRNA (uracil1939-C5)-methyltransferase